MPVGTVDSSQRTAGVVHASWYSHVYSSKSWISLGDLGVGVAVGLRQAGHDLVRRLVGVHLVTDQQQQVRPSDGRRRGHPGGQGDQRIGTELVEVGVVERRRTPTAPERQAEGRVGIDRADDARRERGVGGRPDGRAVELDRVGDHRARPEVLEADQRVVVAVDAPRRCGVTATVGDDLDDARAIGLDPDRRPGLVDVAQQRPDEEVGPAGLAGGGNVGRDRHRDRQRTATRRISVDHPGGPRGHPG